MSLRTLLVDDEPIALRGLAQRLRQAPDIEIVDTCGDGPSAIAAVNELKPDLVFLDIQMPGLSGFDVIDAVGLAHMPPVVFVTAYDQFALRAFDVHAVDYVLKPIDGERFHRALNQVRHRVAAASDGQVRTAAALDALGQTPQRWARRLAIRTGGRVLLVDVSDIDRIDAAGNYAAVVVGAKTWLMRETLSSLEGRLDPSGFARISRAAIVNLARVRALQPMSSGDFVVTLSDGSRVAGSRRYRQALGRCLA